MHYTTIDSPIGPLLLAGDESALRLLWFVQGRHVAAPDPAWIEAPARSRRGRAADRVFRRAACGAFDVPVEPGGTPFQSRVWRGAAGHPVRRDHQLRRAGPADRRSRRPCGPWAWPTAPIPISIIIPVPPGDRRQRLADRLRRRVADQARAAGARAGAARVPLRPDGWRDGESAPADPPSMLSVSSRAQFWPQLGQFGMIGQTAPKLPALSITHESSVESPASAMAIFK